MSIDAPPRPEPAQPDATGLNRLTDRPSAKVSRRLRISGRAPARPAPSAAFHSVSAATAVLLGLVAIGAAIHEPVLIPPLAASAALVHSAPTLPLAQPRSVVIGHLIGALVGYAVLGAAGSSPWAAAVAAGVTLALNTAARTPHSPACASAVVIVLQTPAPVRFVPLLLGSAVLLVLTGYAASRIRRTAPRYPAYWW
ncbi:HPP family protein [Streptomyces sp. ISL-36]|uniref:HPP family protein n=1 Tax=Streptomyces sp. ISL-36 TaxID=2819182 RepID=UPI001BE656FA|nr:HPP family protein [Streptomyces sp. ISL-36]MBT2442896.1 HPP family protein [Streptomyces sp. ISL-36]